MGIKNNFKHTLYSSYAGYFVQAIINNFLPLLFLTFQNQFDFSYSKISALILVNFLVQLAVDFLSVYFIDKIGYRRCIVAAHFLAAAGLVLLGILPFAFKNAYIGVLTSIFIYALGSGLIEVIISPLVEACPTENKSGNMSLLHSFYCWGQMSVIALSTLFFSVFSISNWRILSCLWAIVPFLNGIYISLVPFPKMLEESGKLSVGKLFKNKTFLVCAVIMFCAGSCELGMSQWASAFAESGLGVSKSLGDLLGPCMFAVLMGTSRIVYAKLSTKIGLKTVMMCSAVLCVISYVLAALSPWAILSLVSCALCGLSVGVMWPGTFSLSAKEIPNGGTAMFALMALFGDLGCSIGPSAVGFAANIFSNELKYGLLCAAVFPLILIAALTRIKGSKKEVK